jgi:signal transduction histidine kinase
LDNLEDKRALDCINEAVEISKGLNNNFLLGEVLSFRSQYYGKNEQFENAKKDAIQALAHADTTNKSVLAKLHYSVLLSSIRNNDKQDAYDYLKKFQQINVEYMEQNWTEKIAEMATKYETEKKELVISQQQQVIKNQNLQRWLLVGGIGVSVLILFLLWYLLRLRNRRNLALTERAEALSERNVALAEHTDLLAEMNATKDKFFSIISHDLKNPALALRDALQLLVDNADLWNADTIKKYYHRLLDTADDQVELLYNLLNWAQMQTGRMDFTPAPFDLAACLRRELSLIRNMAEKKGVALAVDLPASAIITGDRNMLTTVARNLLTNAVKFTPAAGTVTLSINGIPAVALARADLQSVRPVSETDNYPSLQMEKQRQDAVVTISDTGVGMTEEQLENLFHIDRKQSLRGTAGEQGTGLGLVVCKELLHKHGITLHAESEKGKGSRFWFSL